jgi:hypothetical protein
MSLGLWITLIFLVLLLTHTVTWPLWVIFLPLMIEVVVDLIILAVVLLGGRSLWKRI